jgi:hypothetical protein
LPPFFVKPDPPALAVGKIILDPHRDDGANTSKRIGHDADQGAVAQPDGDEPIEQHPDGGEVLL